MNAQQIVSNFIAHVTPRMHSIRRRALVSTVDSVMRGSPLTVTQLGRGITGTAREKHRIKRADRLLSNGHLQKAVPEIYTALTLLFTNQLKRPLISIDWSDLDQCGTHFLLRAGVAFQGRSLTLYEEVHHRDTKEKPATHRQFLQRLARMLPPDCRPILITDAGFRVPWFKLVEELHWDFLGRVRNRNHCRQTGDDNWIYCKDLYHQARSTAQHLGRWRLTQSHAYPVNFVLYKEPNRGRQKLTRQGLSARSRGSEKAAKSAREPWLLATSLTGIATHTARKIVRCYRTRMQIEEGFRDMKSIRTGMAGNLLRCSDSARLQVLILISTLAYLISIWCGLATDAANQRRFYQVNTVSNRRVLSLFFGYTSVTGKQP